MANAISFEYLISLAGRTDGLATLDSTGKIPIAQMPSGAIDTFKGTYADEAALSEAHASSATGDYAYVTATASYWYWNAALATPAWVNQEITATNYMALTPEAKKGAPYIIVP